MSQVRPLRIIRHQVEESLYLGQPRPASALMVWCHVGAVLLLIGLLVLAIARAGGSIVLGGQ